MASVRKQIVAMGGDSVSAEPKALASTYHRLIRAGFPAGYAADDGAALHFADRRLEVCVASRPTAGVYGVGAYGETLTETALPVRFLG